MLRNGSLFATFLFLAAGFAVTASASHQEEQGIELFTSFQGSANSVGLVNRLDTEVGYRFNRHFRVGLGIPLYFVKPSDSTAGTESADFRSGLGNVYANVRLTLVKASFRFNSVLTGTAPTGDEIQGFSTGRGSVDWTNTLSNDFRWAVPFVSIGLANTVSDTAFFVRPFTSVGFVANVQAGSYLRLNNFSSVAFSGYRVLPSGEQTIVSRLVPRENVPAAIGETDDSGPPFPVPGRGRGGSGMTPAQPFEVVFETVGEADLAKDHGFSAWWSLYPLPDVDFYAGYSRSIPFDLNTFFFGVTLNVGSMIRKAGH
jgi:hypothetical protein